MWAHIQRVEAMHELAGTGATDGWAVEAWGEFEHRTNRLSRTAPLWLTQPQQLSSRPEVDVWKPGSRRAWAGMRSASFHGYCTSLANATRHMHMHSQSAGKLTALAHQVA